MCMWHTIHVHNGLLTDIQSSQGMDANNTGRPLTFPLVPEVCNSMNLFSMHSCYLGASIVWPLVCSKTRQFSLPFCKTSSNNMLPCLHKHLVQNLSVYVLPEQLPWLKTLQSVETNCSITVCKSYCCSFVVTRGFVCNWKVLMAFSQLENTSK